MQLGGRPSVRMPIRLGALAVWHGIRSCSVPSGVLFEYEFTSREILSFVPEDTASKDILHLHLLVVASES